LLEYKKFTKFSKCRRIFTDYDHDTQMCMCNRAHFVERDRIVDRRKVLVSLESQVGSLNMNEWVAVVALDVTIQCGTSLALMI